jgi:hypothetical protein
MPAKRTGDLWNKLTQDNFDPDFISMRRMGLERFLNRIKSQPKLASDKIVYEFLTNDTGWPDQVEGTDYQKKSGLIEKNASKYIYYSTF